MQKTAAYVISSDSPVIPPVNTASFARHLAWEIKLEGLLLKRAEILVKRIINYVRPGVALLLYFAVLSRMLLLNIPAIGSFFQEVSDEYIKAEVLKSGRTEYSEGKVSTELTPAAMVKDSSESVAEIFSKSTKYPLLLAALFTLSKLLAELTIFRLLPAAHVTGNKRIRKHLSYSILRI